MSHDAGSSAQGGGVHTPGPEPPGARSPPLHAGGAESARADRAERAAAGSPSEVLPDRRPLRDASASPGRSDSPRSTDSGHLWRYPRRPRDFSSLSRLRSPWSGSTSASMRGGRTPSGGSSVLYPTDRSPPLSAHDEMDSDVLSVVDKASLERPPRPPSAAREPARAPVPFFDAPDAPDVRPFLELHQLRRVTHDCATVDTLGGVPNALHVSSGLVVVGLTSGATLVFDLSQRLRCVCQTSATLGRGHAVTSLAVSADGSYVGVGHASGHLLLYDTLDFERPARHVPPVTAEEVLAGKREGHLLGASVTHLQFVGKRKTAVVSADSLGLCFYYSLGRVLGMASHDTLRVYGQYPAPSASMRGAPEPLHALYDAAPLPPGSCAHASDEYRLVAVLTRSKLLVVRLKPTPSTWYRTYSAGDHPCSALAWLPAAEARDARAAARGSRGVQHPVLAFAFGTELRALRLRAVRVRAEEPGRETTALLAEEETLGHAPEPIERLQWVRRQLLFVCTPSWWLLYDTGRARFAECQPLDPLLLATGGGPGSKLRPGTAQQRMLVWRSKAFLLAEDQVWLGDFLPWDTRLRQLAQAGEHMAAIELATALYQGRGLGAAIGLPLDHGAQQQAIGARIDELGRAAAGRILGQPHASAAERAALAYTCANASVVTQRFDFLFDELYDAYELHGYEGLFANALEEFILRGEIRRPPTGVVQRLLAFRARQQERERLESLVLHVDPACLDLEQVLRLCAEHALWDAFVYVYTEAMEDYAAAFRELFAAGVHGRHTATDDTAAYTLLAFLRAALTGKRYPSLDPAPRDKAVRGCAAVSGALFAPRAEAAAAPTVSAGAYPNVVQLLHRDAEAFLSVLDEVFECDLFADQDDAGAALPTRRGIVDVMLALCSGEALLPDELVFVAIFVARNAPKYPQFLALEEGEVELLFDTLTRLAGSGDSSTVDAEFALECLLSAHPVAYTSARLEALRGAQFWRVLELALRKTRRWDALLALVLQDTTQAHAQAPGVLAERLVDALSTALRDRGADRGALFQTLRAHLAQIADMFLAELAGIVARFFPEQQEQMYRALATDAWRQYLYLEPCFMPRPSTRPAGAHAQRLALPAGACSVWVPLVAQFNPQRMVESLAAHPQGTFDLGMVAAVAREHRVYDAVLWAHDQRGEWRAAMDLLDEVVQEQARAVLELVASGGDQGSASTTERVLHAGREQLRVVEGAVRMAVRLSAAHGEERGASVPAAELRERWYRLLRALVSYFHVFAAAHAQDGPLATLALGTGRALMQEALAALITSVPSETVSFPTLFRRLVEDEREAPAGAAARHTFGEVRVAVCGMLSAYRLRCDVLQLGVGISEADVARLFHELAKERGVGWLFAREQLVCRACGQALSAPSGAALFQGGAAFHAGCHAPQSP